MKKGFTLVELLAVIVILSVISMLVFPNVIKIINQSKENLYQSQLRDIENVAKNFSIEHPELLDANRINATYVTLDALKQSGYLEVDKINNPKNGQEMNGCIKIQYNESNNQYNYNYEEINCSNDATLKGYIITYQNGLNKEERNIVLSAYEKVLSDYNNLVSIVGGTTDGLYDIDVVETGGYLTDHYDPTKKVIRLSRNVYRDASIGAVAVACHECGHAIQDKENYKFMRTYFDI